MKSYDLKFKIFDKKERIIFGDSYIDLELGDFLKEIAYISPSILDEAKRDLNQVKTNLLSLPELTRFSPDSGTNELKYFKTVNSSLEKISYALGEIKNSRDIVLIYFLPLAFITMTLHEQYGFPFTFDLQKKPSIREIVNELRSHSSGSLRDLIIPLLFEPVPTPKEMLFHSLEKLYICLDRRNFSVFLGGSLEEKKTQVKALLAYIDAVIASSDELLHLKSFALNYLSKNTPLDNLAQEYEWFNSELIDSPSVPTIRNMLANEIRYIQRYGYHFNRCNLCDRYFLTDKKNRYCSYPNKEFDGLPCNEAYLKFTNRKTGKVSSYRKSQMVAYDNWIRGQRKITNELSSCKCISKEMISEINPEIYSRHDAWLDFITNVFNDYVNFKNSEDFAIEKLQMPSIEDRSPLLKSAIKQMKEYKKNADILE